MGSGNQTHTVKLGGKLVLHPVSNHVGTAVAFESELYLLIFCVTEMKTENGPNPKHG